MSGADFSQPGYQPAIGHALAAEQAAVIVPAHNESLGIRRCLRHLSTDEALVVVVANGCDDDTAAQARSFNDVVVIERAEPSKVEALNEGDRSARGLMPRIYLDADVELDGRSLTALVAALRSEAAPLLAIPRPVFDTTGSSFPVRAFFRIYRKMPYVSEGFAGAGCYAVNAAGRQRWDSFPKVVADDLYVHGLFGESERVVVGDSVCVARAPRTLKALIAVRVRTYVGNRQLDLEGLSGEMAGSTSRSLKALARLLVKEPARLLDGALYIGINLLARRRSRRQQAGGPWLRDLSTR